LTESATPVLRQFTPPIINNHKIPPFRTGGTWAERQRSAAGAARPLKRSVRRRLSAEHHIDAEQDQLKLCSGQLSHTFNQRSSIEGCDL
jgi:hypothetical protein